MIETLEQTTLRLPDETINRRMRLQRTVELIKGLAANFYELEIDEMMTRRRTDRVAHARQLAMTLIREHTSLTLMDIGGLFDRDHGTVIHAIKAVKRRCKTDSGFWNSFDQCSWQVRRSLNG